MIVAAAALLSTISSLEWVALPVVVVAAGLLGWLVVRQGRDAAKEHRGSDELRRRTVDLEGQVQAGVADARASGERLRTIIDSAVDGIIVIDQNGHIESLNPAAERLFGYPRSEVVGRNISMLMPSPYDDEHDGYLSLFV